MVWLQKRPFQQLSGLVVFGFGMFNVYISTKINKNQFNEVGNTNNLLKQVFSGVSKDQISIYDFLTSDFETIDKKVQLMGKHAEALLEQEMSDLSNMNEKVDLKTQEITELLSNRRRKLKAIKEDGEKGANQLLNLDHDINSDHQTPKSPVEEGIEFKDLSVFENQLKLLKGELEEVRAKKLHGATRREENLRSRKNIIEVNGISSNTSPKKNANESARYAYAYVLGAVHEDRLGYKGFLYDILISINLLKNLGSNADFWVWVQMSPDSSLDELPKDDATLLKAIGTRIQYLPKPDHESFTQLVFNKLRILQMTEYHRVMFLDGDTIPLVNLDYLFYLSDPNTENNNNPVLRPNLIMSSKGEPCNAGLFILQPEYGAWEKLQEIINNQREAGKKLPYPHFDWEEGWGHNFLLAGDGWESTRFSSKKHWKFHAGHSDQGLLYYWAKYFKQDVSIVIGNRLQNWVASETRTDMPIKISETKDELDEYSPKPLVYMHKCNIVGNHPFCTSPYKDFTHFMGGSKPWQGKSTGKIFRMGDTDTENNNAPTRLWFKELAKINEKLDIGLDLNAWNTKYLPLMNASPLGKVAKFSDNAKLLNQS